MCANTAEIQSLIEKMFTSTLKKLENDASGNCISDMYVQVDAETGELQLFDETEHLLNKIVLFDWVNSGETEEAFNKRVAASLKAVLTILNTKKAFDKPCFMKPLSISLTDDEFVVIEELLFLDDDTLRVDDPLLKDLDSDLDNFLSDLLGDVK